MLRCRPWHPATVNQASNGPVCPVYGFGVVIVLWVLEPGGEPLLPSSWSGLSPVEWLTGFVLSGCFTSVWWDHFPGAFNLGGYICLRFHCL
ncbi:MAG: putative ABC transporter permease [Flavonifractor plautii]